LEKITKITKLLSYRTTEPDLSSTLPLLLRAKISKLHVMAAFHWPGFLPRLARARHNMIVIADCSELLHTSVLLQGCLQQGCMLEAACCQISLTLPHQTIQLLYNQQCCKSTMWIFHSWGINK